MAWTTADLEALDAKIANATRRVRHGDKEVEQHDLEKLLKLRDKMARALNGTARVYRARCGRG